MVEGWFSPELHPFANGVNELLTRIALGKVVVGYRSMFALKIGLSDRDCRQLLSDVGKVLWIHELLSLQCGEHIFCQQKNRIRYAS